MTTPRVVTGLWFSIEAMVNPFESVETLSGSDLTNSLSVFATEAWAANCLLAVAWKTMQIQCETLTINFTTN